MGRGFESQSHPKCDVVLDFLGSEDTGDRASGHFIYSNQAALEF